MTQHDIEAVQFWLDTTKRDIKVTERMIKVFKHKFMRMLEADIEANTEALHQKWSQKRLQMIGFMQSLHDALERF